MRIRERTHIYNKARYLDYTEYRKILTVYIPKRKAYASPLYKGHVLMLNLKRALFQLKYSFADIVRSTKGGFIGLYESFGSPDAMITVDDAKSSTVLLYESEDQVVLYNETHNYIIYKVLLLEYNSIFGIPYSEEYFEEPLEVGDSVGLNGVFMKKAKTGEGAIGIFLGYNSNTKMAYIKFKPHIALETPSNQEENDSDS